MRGPLFSLFALLLAVTLALSACGQTGPLYLPDKPADAAQRDKKPPQQP